MGNLFRYIYGNPAKVDDDKDGTTIPRNASPPGPITPTPPIVTPIPPTTIAVTPAPRPPPPGPITPNPISHPYIITPPGPITPTPPYIALTPRPRPRPPIPIAITPPPPVVTPGPITPSPGGNWNSTGPPGVPPGGVTLPPGSSKPLPPDECCYGMMTTKIVIKSKINKGSDKVVSIEVDGSQTEQCSCYPCDSLNANGEPNPSMQNMLLNQSSIGPPIPKKAPGGSTTYSYTEETITVATMCDTGGACAHDIENEGGDTVRKNILCSKSTTMDIKKVKISGNAIKKFVATNLGKRNLYDVGPNGSFGLWDDMQNSDQAEISLGGRKKLELPMNCAGAPGRCASA